MWQYRILRVLTYIGMLTIILCGANILVGTKNEYYVLILALLVQGAIRVNHYLWTKIIEVKED